MATASKDVGESSDIVHEFPCKPCADDGKDIEGVNFCGECQTYFCHACVQFHNKCFKTHTIFNKSGVKSGKIQYEQQPGGLACEKHAGNLIQMYCGEHDMVCCAVCVAVDHRLCKSADFIPKLSKEILNGRDRKDVKIALEGIRKQLHTMKAHKLEQIKEIGKEKAETLTEIVKMKESVIAKVEEMERNSVKQVEEKHDRIVGTIKTDIACIDGKLNAIDTNIEKINRFKGDNEAKLFVVLNKAHKIEVDSSGYVDKNTDKKYDRIEFEINPRIASFICELDAFGSAKGDGCKASVYTLSTYSHISGALLVKEIPVKGSDSCMIDNGQIIVVSSGLKILDKTYKVLDSVCRNARHLCKVGPSEIAVLCGNVIGFIDPCKSLEVARSFRISHCRMPEEKEIYGLDSEGYINSLNWSGISFFHGKLLSCFKLDTYTKCNTFRKSYVGVSVYDLKGNHVDTCMFELSRDVIINHATYSSWDSCMYISTTTKGLLVFDTANKEVKTITDKRLQNPHHVCEMRKGQFFVCGRDSHNVFLYDKKNNSMEEILGSSDGIWEPLSVMYMEQQNSILVTSASKNIKVYQLK